MKKFYAASSFQNIDSVRYVSSKLLNNGFIQTYDWTQNERASTVEDLKKIGQQERNAVMEADFLIVLLPAGKGSHIEFGIALSQGKRIYLYSPTEKVHHMDTTSTFYHLPEVKIVIGSIDNFVKVLIAEEFSSKRGRKSESPNPFFSCVIPTLSNHVYLANCYHGASKSL